MKTLLSEKRQIAIPKQLCEALDLSAGAQVDWEIQDGFLIGIPIPKGGWKKLRGSIPRHEAAQGLKTFQRARDEERRRG